MFALEAHFLIQTILIFYTISLNIKWYKNKFNSYYYYLRLYLNIIFGYKRLQYFSFLLTRPNQQSPNVVWFSIRNTISSENEHVCVFLISRKYSQEIHKYTRMSVSIDQSFPQCSTKPLFDLTYLVISLGSFRLVWLVYGA